MNPVEREEWGPTSPSIASRIQRRPSDRRLAKTVYCYHERENAWRWRITSTYDKDGNCVAVSPPLTNPNPPGPQRLEVTEYYFDGGPRPPSGTTWDEWWSERQLFEYVDNELVRVHSLEANPLRGRDAGSA